MASEKKQNLLKPIRQAGGGAKSSRSKELPQGADSSTDDDDELERNFALFNKKRSPLSPEEEDEEGSSEDEAEEHAEDLKGNEENAESDVESAGGENEQVEDEEDDNDSESGEDSDGDVTQGGGCQGKPETESHIRRDLSSMSFEEIMQLQKKVGMKAYNRMAYGTSKSKQQAPRQMKRLNKHRPQEISAKKPVPFLRKVVPVKKSVSRDPRFDDLSGDYKPEIFDQTYRFINDIRQKERLTVKKNLKKIKSKNKKEELQFLLKRMDNQERERKRKEQHREKELEFKRKQREMVGEGHRPFYLKKSDKKKLELAERYTDLKKSGKLENFLSKKRKRNAMKDRRRLPNKQKSH
ncbi:ribosomal RNA processing protein 36 homolog [Denticeps clupeoides]|uniref:rRNA biogenesis protein RRP36 n=1 Tax=Denticeps clupeoides TaxID=299321 RepID=A0AAY4ACM0_9TELE|nr:ribosomal RNA processing protein 36 homolog [Denticeps clupeoides]